MKFGANCTMSLAGLEDWREIFAAAFFETLLDGLFETLFKIRFKSLFAAFLAFFESCFGSCLESRLLRLAIIGSARGVVLMERRRMANKAGGGRQPLHTQAWFEWEGSRAGVRRQAPECGREKVSCHNNWPGR